jgi:hypothetical protein
LREKLVGLFPAQLKVLKDLFAGAFDRLLALGADLVNDPAGAWRKFTAGGVKGLLENVVKALIPLVRDPAVRAIQNAPIRGLVSRLIDAVGDLVADPSALAGAARNPSAALQLVLPKVAKVLRPFVDEAVVAIVPKGILRDLVKLLVDGLVGLLEQPSDLTGLVKRIQTGSPKALVKGFLEKAVLPKLLELVGAGEPLKSMVGGAAKALLQKL